MMDVDWKNETLPGRAVPFFDYSHVFGSDEQALLSIVRDVARRGAFIMQRELEMFERNLARYVGAKHVVGVANATDALHFAVRAAGIGPGDEVVFCAHTMVATAAAVHFAGATPVPVECGSDHLIDPSAVEAAITPRTRAILPTQLNGRVADMEALTGIARRHGLHIIEDAAQALGARYQQTTAGTIGLAGAISFYPAKSLGALGDGGCLITNDTRIYETVRLLRDHGRASSGDVVLWGLNSRLDNLQAAILDYKLARYDAAIARRRELAALYQDHLGDVPQLDLPPAPGSEPERFDIFQNYEVEAQDRDALRAYLHEHGIGTLVPWNGKAVHQFQNLKLKASLPFTESVFRRLLLLPLNPALDDTDVMYVCQVIREFYDRP